MNPKHERRFWTVGILVLWSIPIGAAIYNLIQFGGVLPH